MESFQNLCFGPIYGLCRRLRNDWFRLLPALRLFHQDWVFDAAGGRMKRPVFSPGLDPPSGGTGTHKAFFAAGGYCLPLQILASAAPLPLRPPVRRRADGATRTQDSAGSPRRAGAICGGAQRGQAPVTQLARLSCVRGLAARSARRPHHEGVRHQFDVSSRKARGGVLPTRIGSRAGALSIRVAA